MMQWQKDMIHALAFPKTITRIPRQAGKHSTLNFLYTVGEIAMKGAN